MKFVIFYFSGTGNTKLIGEEISKRIEKEKHKIQLISIESLNELTEFSFEKTVIGVGFPVYKFTNPEILQNLLNYLDQLQKKERFSKAIPFFTFCTYARFPANSLHNFMKDLESEQYYPIAQLSLKCPSNGIASMKSAESYEYQTVMYFENNIRKKLDNFVEDILQKSGAFFEKKFRIKHHGNLLEPLKLKIVKDIEKIKYPLLQIDRVKCSNCGLCAKKCPTKNLLKKDDGIEILDQFDCLHCLRCMHLCPSEAISFGALTNGPNRYKSKIRLELFSRAQNNNETCVLNEKKVKRIWRREAIKYWIKNRRKVRKMIETLVLKD